MNNTGSVLRAVTGGVRPHGLRTKRTNRELKKALKRSRNGSQGSE